MAKGQQTQKMVKKPKKDTAPPKTVTEEKETYDTFKAKDSRQAERHQGRQAKKAKT